MELRTTLLTLPPVFGRCEVEAPPLRESGALVEGGGIGGGIGGGGGCCGDGGGGIG